MSLTQALKRPLNYNDLPASEQWAIDKRLGILDWEPTQEEINEYVRQRNPQPEPSPSAPTGLELREQEMKEKAGSTEGKMRTYDIGFTADEYESVAMIAEEKGITVSEWIHQALTKALSVDSAKDYYINSRSND
jgi:hypothetical protein